MTHKELESEVEWPASHKQEDKKGGPLEWGIIGNYHFFPVVMSVLSITVIISVEVVMYISRYAEHPEDRQHDVHREFILPDIKA